MRCQCRNLAARSFLGSARSLPEYLVRDVRLANWHKELTRFLWDATDFSLSCFCYDSSPTLFATGFYYKYYYWHQYFYCRPTVGLLQVPVLICSSSLVLQTVSVPSNYYADRDIAQYKELRWIRWDFLFPFEKIDLQRHSQGCTRS